MERDGTTLPRESLRHQLGACPPLDAADEDEAMVHYRRVRDEICDYVEQLPGILAGLR